MGLLVFAILKLFYKGYKSKNDVMEAKNKARESRKEETKDVFFYDWLNDD